MALTFQQLREDVKLTEFTYRGQSIDLVGSLGQRVMSTTRLDMLIHEAGREIQAEVKDKREIDHNHCILDSDALPLPSDMLILGSVIIYPDDNVTEVEGAVTGATSATVLIDADATFVTDEVAVGDRVDNTTDGSAGLVLTIDSETQLTLASSLTGGTNNAFTADDTYEIYDPDAETAYAITEGMMLTPSMTMNKLTEGNASPAGKPTSYMVQEQDGIQHLLFNVMADKRYFIDVFYWPTLADMAGDGTELKLRAIYQSLYYLKTCEKVALRLGDDRSLSRFAAMYESEKGKLASIKQARGFSQTRYRVMP